MNPIDKLKLLYMKEINFVVASFWDGGYTVKVGDKMNGYKAEHHCYELEDAIDWLYRTAQKLYPKAFE